MTAPAPFTSTTFVDGEAITSVSLYTRLLQWLNQLLTLVLGTGRGFLMENFSGTPEIAVSGTFAGGAKVTFTLATQRRVRVVVKAGYRQAGAAAGSMSIQVGISSGSTVNLAAVALFGPRDFIQAAASGYAGQTGGGTEGTALLAAGTYTAYAVCSRIAGGSTSDMAGEFYVAVYDAGAS